MRTTNNWMTARGLGTSLVAIALLTGAGCNKQNSATNPAETRTDQQVANDIQSKINGESALTGQNIQVGVQNGVATLNGAVSDNASRSLAANDAGTVSGVKTVINNLTVQAQADNQPAVAAPVPVQKPTASREDREQARRERRQEERAANGHRTRDGHNDRNQQNDQQAQQGEQAPPPQPAPQEQVQLVPPPSQARPRPVAKTVTIEPGTVVPVRVTESLDSAHTQPNDVFHGSLAGDLIVDGMVAIPQGSPIVGKVVDAKDAAHFRGSSLLSIQVTQLTSHGRGIPVTTDAYTKEGKGRGRNTAEKTGGGAALGAIIGAIAGGGKGAAIGAAAGGGIGAGANGVTRGEQVQIDSESLVNFRLQSPVTVTTSQTVGGPRTYNNDNNGDEPHLDRRQ